MIDVLFVLTVFLLGIYVGLSCAGWGLARAVREKPEAVDALKTVIRAVRRADEDDPNPDPQAVAAQPAEPFAVARRERRPSWRERRRELEAKHRTERKKLEEWRD